MTDSMKKRFPSILASGLLWILAIVVMVAISGWQRRTGPTWPRQGTLSHSGLEISYTLPRSGNTDRPALITLPAASETLRASLQWRRYPLQEPFQTVTMVAHEGSLQAALPTQPAAGKLEYYLSIDEGAAQIPPDRAVVFRFKDPVPAWALVPHIIFMFLAVIVGFRTILEATLGRVAVRSLSQATLGLLILGGLVFGPIVQKYAFGAAWTGVPFGWDLTDNKTLLMVLFWAGALAVLGRVSRKAPNGASTPARSSPLERAAVLAAGLLMLLVYQIPHSMRGSQLDYEKVDQGVDPTRAVGQGSELLPK